MNRTLLTISKTLFIILWLSGAADAMSLKNTGFSIAIEQPPDTFNNEPLGICSFARLCQSGSKTILPDLNPNVVTPPQQYVNDTGFAITNVLAELLENRPQGLGVFVEGNSDIFSDIGISDNQQNLLFTEGIIPVGEVITVDFETEPESDSTLFLTLNSTLAAPTPEPSFLVGLLTLAFFSTNRFLEKKR
jgi:hypothetical protein